MRSHQSPVTYILGRNALVAPPQSVREAGQRRRGVGRAEVARPYVEVHGAHLPEVRVQDEQLLLLPRLAAGHCTCPTRGAQHSGREAVAQQCRCTARHMRHPSIAPAERFCLENDRAGRAMQAPQHWHVIWMPVALPSNSCGFHCNS